MAGQHGGARDLGLRGGRASGVAGEAALRHHLGQKGLMLADYAGDADGVVWRVEGRGREGGRRGKKGNKRAQVCNEKKAGGECAQGSSC